MNTYKTLVILITCTSLVSAAHAQGNCLALLSKGALFLHQQNQRLHTSPQIQHTVTKAKLRGATISQKPVDKIAAWLEQMDKTHTKARNNPATLERLKNYYFQRHVIKPEEIPQSYFDLQVQIAREQGHGTITLSQDVKQEMAATLIDDQKKSLEIWLDYFLSEDSNSYPIWAKYWAFTSLVHMGLFNADNATFGKRSGGLVAMFPELNHEALAYVMDALVKKVGGQSLNDIEDPKFRELLKTDSFSKLYGWALRKTKLGIEKLAGSVEGRWVTYRQGSDHMPLVRSLRGQLTGWCTAGESTAKAQLELGDLHVYYSLDTNNQPTIPRIAIRMEENQIAEIRGVEANQNLDSQIAGTDILNSKLKEFGTQDELYKKKSAHMKLLTEIEQKQNNGQDLTKDELLFLYEVDEEIIGFGYNKDPRIEEIIKKRNNIRSDLANALDCKLNEISLTENEATQGGIRFHRGSLYLKEYTSAEGLDLPTIISGTLNLNNLKSAKGLILPKRVGGSLHLSRLTNVSGLILPIHVGGSLDLIGLTSADGLALPQSVGKNLYLTNLIRSQGITFPLSVGGTLDLDSLIEADGAILPRSVGGAVILRSLETVNGLTLPENIGLSLSLQSLKTARKLILPQAVGHSLNLYNLQTFDKLVLPKSVGHHLNLGNLRSAKNVTFPKSIGQSLELVRLSSSQDLVLPQSVGHNIYLNEIDSIKSLDMPDFIGGNISLPSRLKEETLLYMPEHAAIINFVN